MFDGVQEKIKRSTGTFASEGVNAKLMFLTSKVRELQGILTLSSISRALLNPKSGNRLSMKDPWFSELALRRGWLWLSYKKSF